MKQMTMRAVVMILFFSLITVGMVIFCVMYSFEADDWALYPSNIHIYSEGQVFRAGTITDINGVVLAKTEDKKRIFAESESVRRSTLHTVGDLDGFIDTGIHSAFCDLLTGYNKIGGVYQYADKGNDIRLTIDSDVCATALDALAGRPGTVGVYNYKTGEIVCMVSSPTYDIENDWESESAKNGEIQGVFVNRFLNGTYPPGSTFKIITSAAAIETLDDAYTREYTCNGGCLIDGEWISCMHNHGTITLKDALAKSCNSYFSQLAADLGKSVMTKYAEKFGFNGSFGLDGIQAKTSVYDVYDARNVDLAWSGMGQFTDMMNPLQYMTAMGAIANNGVAVKPYFIKSVKNPIGTTVKSGHTQKYGRWISASTAKQLQELMSNNVEQTYGTYNFEGLELCAKSGTAEIGKGRTPNAVFVGFTQNDDLPLAFVVVVENGGAGSTVAGGVANRVLQAARNNIGE